MFINYKHCNASCGKTVNFSSPLYPKIQTKSVEVPLPPPLTLTRNLKYHQPTSATTMWHKITHPILSTSNCLIVRNHRVMVQFQNLKVYALCGKTPIVYVNPNLLGLRIWHFCSWILNVVHFPNFKAIWRKSLWIISMFGY